ncbi:MAG: FHIPEP family type III secretion protein, partial [Aureliella sp.]
MNAVAFLNRYRDLILPVAIIGCVGVILVPLPPLLMDVLLAANVAISILILLTTIYIRTPLEFNVFPTLLLATTLARLV